MKKVFILILFVLSLFSCSVNFIEEQANLQILLPDQAGAKAVLKYQTSDVVEYEIKISSNSGYTEIKRGQAGGVIDFNDIPAADYDISGWAIDKNGYSIALGSTNVTVLINEVVVVDLELSLQYKKSFFVYTPKGAWLSQESKQSIFGDKYRVIDARHAIDMGVELSGEPDNPNTSSIDYIKILDSSFDNSALVYQTAVKPNTNWFRVNLQACAENPGNVIVALQSFKKEFSPIVQSVYLDTSFGDKFLFFNTPGYGNEADCYICIYVTKERGMVRVFENLNPTALTSEPVDITDGFKFPSQVTVSPVNPSGVSVEDGSSTSQVIFNFDKSKGNSSAGIGALRAESGDVDYITCTLRTEDGSVRGDLFIKSFGTEEGVYSSVYENIDVATEPYSFNLLIPKKMAGIENERYAVLFRPETSGKVTLDVLTYDTSGYFSTIGFEGLQNKAFEMANGSGNNESGSVLMLPGESIDFEVIGEISFDSYDSTTKSRTIEDGFVPACRIHKIVTDSSEIKLNTIYRDGHKLCRLTNTSGEVKVAKLSVDSSAGVSVTAAEIPGITPSNRFPSDIKRVITQNNTVIFRENFRSFKYNDAIQLTQDMITSDNAIVVYLTAKFSEDVQNVHVKIYNKRLNKYIKTYVYNVETGEKYLGDTPYLGTHFQAGNAKNIDVGGMMEYFYLDGNYNTEDLELILEVELQDSSRFPVEAEVSSVRFELDPH